jgi:hypothetical protein
MFLCIKYVVHDSRRIFALDMLRWMFTASFIPFSTHYSLRISVSIPCNSNRVQNSVATHRNSPMWLLMYTKYIWYCAD